MRSRSLEYGVASTATRAELREEISDRETRITAYLPYAAAPDQVKAFTDNFYRVRRPRREYPADHRETRSDDRQPAVTGWPALVGEDQGGGLTVTKASGHCASRSGPPCLDSLEVDVLHQHAVACGLNLDPPAL
ncbi:hypothetical protein [Actinoplanes couchii]|uniref:Uncharacterized protein n=1 Tax=Actinoplanes couchii TaxID=403638 RepID=A0ABQ3XRR2_9ACTN|nr:hypothetical protein [Actinoplanes couchii]MDR6318866.1 hypothetical protein [Actinoplanes couchii]GID61193.1 hypothetical protein Aco03nite_095970 [Actinoplanes couchii]